jgi:hypothetical protein
MAWRAARRARAASELAQDLPGRDLGVGAVARSAQLGAGPVGVICEVAWSGCSTG